jgi:hypothetical protein
MNTCGGCKFLGKEITEWDVDFKDEIGTGYFACDRIKHDTERRPKKGQGAFVKDGSGYFAALCVEDDFACNKWEPR